MNGFLAILGVGLLCIGTYLLIVRLSRRDEGGRQLWRKLITPTPLAAFSSNDEEVIRKEQ